LTESPAIGTASEAIRSLALTEDQKQLLIGHIAVADAICYLFGTIGVIWCCASLGPKLLHIDVRKESKQLERTLGIEPLKAGIHSGWQPIGLRAYALNASSRAVGKTVAEAEKLVPATRLFIERIRRGQHIFSPAGSTVLEAGDVLAVIGRTEIMINLLGPTSSEVADPELLDIPVASFDLRVTSRAVSGKTLQWVVDEVREARGVLLRGITRGERSLPVGTNTIVERGDVLHIIGSEPAVTKLGAVVGTINRPPEDTNLAVLGIAVFAGVLLGAAVVIPLGHLRIVLGTSVGTLLAGLVVGWMRSVTRWFGDIPHAAILFMRSIGLTGFVAMIGLKAGPIFLNAVRQYGFALFFGGILVTLVPLISGLFFGRYVLRVNPILLLGGVAGAQTMIAGVAALEEKADSSIATLGYSYTVAFGHILLTTWGTLIVYLLS
jgi:putative transport protein